MTDSYYHYGYGTHYDFHYLDCSPYGSHYDDCRDTYPYDYHDCFHYCYHYPERFHYCYLDDYRDYHYRGYYCDCEQLESPRSLAVAQRHIRKRIGVAETTR